MAFETSTFDGSESPLRENNGSTDRWAKGSTTAAVSDCKKASDTLQAVTAAADAFTKITTARLTVGSDQYSQIGIASFGSQGHFSGPAARIGATQADCYALLIENLAGTDQLRLFQQIDDGVGITSVQLGSTVAQEVAGGDTLRLECEGTALRGKHNGITLISVTDASYASGQPGVNIFVQAPPVSDVQLDNFSGGDLEVVETVEPEDRLSSKYLADLGIALKQNEWAAVASATNATATATKAAEAGRRHTVTHLFAGYDGTTARTGLLTVTGFGGVTMTFVIRDAEPISVGPLLLPVNVAAVASLAAAGAAGVIGYVVMIGKTD